MFCGQDVLSADGAVTFKVGLNPACHFRLEDVKESEEMR
jgi:hypothetical protein